LSLIEGHYGVVILPDAATWRRARALARDTVGAADHATNSPVIPLFYAHFTGLRSSIVANILGRLRKYGGHALEMQIVEPHGARALVWKAVCDDVLRSMQCVCLTLGRYVDRDLPFRGEKDSLVIAPEELDAFRQSGYPFVSRFFIELAYRRQGWEKERRRARQKVTIRDIVFAEIGCYGSFTKVADV